MDKRKKCVQAETASTCNSQLRNTMKLAHNGETLKSVDLYNDVTEFQIHVRTALS